MDGDGIIAFAEILVAPDLVKELFRADHVALFLTEDTQDGEFGGSEGEGLLIEQAFVGIDVDHQAGMGDDRLISLRRGIVFVVTSQLRLDPGYHLQRAERLGDIIIRAQGQPGDLVRLLILGGEHDDGIIMILPDPAAEVKAIAVGEHDIDDGQIQPGLADTLQGLFCGIEFIDLVILICEIELDQIGDLPLVVHDKYPVAHKR